MKIVPADGGGYIGTKRAKMGEFNRLGRGVYDVRVLRNERLAEGQGRGLGKLPGRIEVKMSGRFLPYNRW